MSTSRSVTAILRAQDNGYTSTMTKASSLLRKLSGDTKTASSSNQSFGSVLKGMVGALGIAKVASMAYSTAMANVNSAMSRQDTLYLYERNLKSAGFAADVVSANLSQLKDAVQDTAYGTDAAANSVQAFVNANMGLDKATNVTQRFMDLNSRFGDGTNETYQRIMFQMNQMATKGKASFQNINTAVESGIPVWQILAKQTGKSVEEIQQSVSKGEMSAEEFFDLLIAGSNDAAGAAKDGANTWAGSIGIMKSRIALGVGEILTSFKSIATSITGDEFGIFKAVTSLGTFIKAGFTKIGQFIQQGFDFAYPYILRFKNMMVSVKEPVMDALNAVKEALSKLWGQFDNVSSLNTFQSTLDVVGAGVKKFAGFIENNAETIAKLIALIPKLVAGLTGLNIVKSVGQKFAAFGADVTGAIGKIFDTTHNLNEKFRANFLTPISDAISGGINYLKPSLDKFTSNFKLSMSTLTEFDDKGKFLNFTRSIGESVSSLFPSFDSFRANLRTSKAQLDQFGGSNVGNFLKSFAAALELSDTKIGKFASSIFSIPDKMKSFGNSLLHPVSSLKSLGTSLAEFSTQAGGSGTVISGVALKIGDGLKGMATAGIGAIKSLGAAIAANPIGLALTAITVAVAGLAMAWKSNFQNIQGYAKSAFSGVIDSLKSLKDMFTNIMPAGLELGDVIKKLGVIFAQGLGLAVGIVVDGFRLLVTGVASVIQGLMALGSAATMVAKAFKGDWKGAGEEFDKVKENINGIKNNMQNFADNSATKKVISSFKELGDTSTEVQATMVADFETIGKANQDLSTKFSETSAKLKEAFKVDEDGEASKGMQEYFSNAESLLNTHQERKQAMIEKSNAIIAESNGKSNEEQVQAQIEAAENILNTVSTSNEAVLALYGEYSQMLKENKTREGQELTEEQRKALQEQTDVIRQGLIEQNQLYVEAAIQKLANGQQLAEQEQTAAITNLQALYANKKDEIASNEEKIRALQEQQQQAKSESERLNYEAQIEALRAANSQMKAEFQQNGDEILAILANGNEVKASTILQGMEQMKNMTNEELSAVFQSFVNNNDSTDQQLALLAGILEQRGVEGATNLSTALLSGDLTTISASMTEEVKTGLNALPDEMFAMGGVGKQQFIKALESGDTERAGQFMVDSTVQGIKSKEGSAKTAGASVGDNATQGLKSKHSDQESTGKQAGEKYSTGLKNQKSVSTSAGKDVGAGADEGLKSNHASQESTGKQAGEKYTSGVKSQRSNANSAGKDVGKANTDGLKSNHSDQESTGKQSIGKYSDGVKSKKSDSQNAGKDVGKANTDGLKSNHSEQESAGKQAGSKYISGITSKKGEAKSAGTQLANSAKSGASGVDFSGVGSSMAGGVAAGIRSNTGSAVSAMASLVNQVNAEARRVAKVNSPSKLMRDGVGKALPEGLGVGISKYAYMAVNSIQRVVGEIYDAAQDEVGDFNVLKDGVITVKKDDHQSEEQSFLKAIVEKMENLMDMKFQMILDTGTLVGELSPGVDSNLGTQAMKGRRNNLW